MNILNKNKIAYMSLTFDFVTLTLGQLHHLINTYHVYNYHQDLIIGSWYIAETFFYKIACLTLTFDLVILNLGQLKHLNNISIVYK